MTADFCQGHSCKHLEEERHSGEEGKKSVQMVMEENMRGADRHWLEGKGRKLRGSSE